MYVCPECNSEDCKKLSLIYERGNASGTISAYIGIDAFTNSSTMASQSASPPVNPLMVGCGWASICGFIWLTSPFIIFILAVMLGLFFQVTHIPIPNFLASNPLIPNGSGHILLNILRVIILLVSVRAVITSTIKYPSKKRNWQRTYQCQRCATYFRISPD